MHTKRKVGAMSLRATYRHPNEREYRRPGGPWDVGSLDAALQATELVDGELRLSPQDVEERVARLAGGLRAAGVRRRDVVAWQLPNVHAAVLLYRACWRLGAVAAPVHHLAGSVEKDAMLSQVEPRLVCEAEDVARLVEHGKPIEEGAAQPADLAVALFTSGSTGVPKAALHTHRGLAHKAHLMARVHALTLDDAVLMPAPLAHISGLLNAVLVPGAVPMKTVLMAKWDPELALQIIRDERITFMIGPPTFFVGLMGAAGFTSDAVQSLRLVSCGGAGVTPAFVASAAETLGCVVKRTYGSTEAPTVTTSHAGDPDNRARETDGRATGEIELRIAADGELLVRGPELFVGYSDEKQTRVAVTRGWFRTGDIGRIDDEGWLTIEGRLKDVIIRGGENIAAAEVEAVLESHPAVRQAVAVGEPDARLGERVAAFVVATEPFDLDTCRAWFAGRGVARFKTPERVVQVDELPVLAAGKPDKEALKRLL